MSTGERWLLAGFALLISYQLYGLRKQLKTEQSQTNRKLDHMAAVQIEQEDLDAVAGTLDALVDAVTAIDTSKLPAADQSALQAALTDLTVAVNEKLPVSVSDGEGAVEAGSE